MGLYIWYSNATDITGRAIAESLSEVLGNRAVSHGENFPDTNLDLLVCYGCKPEKDFNYDRLRSINLLNDPRSIRRNANKLDSLVSMRNNGVLVADFYTAEHARTNGLPDMGQKVYIARRKFHQGGKGLVLVVQTSDIQFALDSGMEYFQVLMPKKDEYRVHIMSGELLFAVKKILQENPYDNWRAERRILIDRRAAKDSIELDERTLEVALDICGKSMRLPDNIIRGLHRGWRFSNVSNPARNLTDAAAGAVQSAGLDFGAVDIMMGEDNRLYVLEVNSGPGLKGQNIERYRDMIRARYESIVNAARVEPRTSRRDPVRATAETRGAGSGDLAAALETALNNVDEMNVEERRQLQQALIKIAAKLAT